MNKSLILALTIAFSSFVSADEIVIPSVVDEAVPSIAENMPSFQTMDTNQDNAISLTEAEAKEGLLTVFLDIDLDRTGDLSEVEYNKFVMTAK